MSAPAAASTSSATLTLSPEILASFKPARVFRKHNEAGRSFTSLSFDDKGEQLITAGEDETIQLFNARTGKHQKQLYSKKYGVHLTRFTHKSSAIIHASTKENDDIRYLSLHDHNYIRYYKGHTKKVVSLQMSPTDDTFLSGATDDTVRLWDLRASHAQGLLNVAGHPCVAYDPSGYVFAVGLNLRSTILLYDIKNFDKQPFLNIQIDDPILSQRTYPPRVPVLTSLAFSNDGKWILVGTSGDVHYVVDSFDGHIVARLECVPQPGSTSPAGVMGLERAVASPYERPMEPSAGLSSEEVKWTPDGRFVVGGSIDGKIHVWDVAPPPEQRPPHYPPPSPECTLFPIKSIDGHVGGPSRAVAFNPKTAMFASAGNDLAFWLPELGEGGAPDPAV
ncbi:WD40 repeat-like protein [Leucosporidium creatinivorum]|uniref:WD40 repeat-like protein n=1 Tax=Leucosporidium creatinivorum TaxID=106004 RepID=A0A1Y2DC84_9BASI|nr:WD40 repeat-like protein [Leucosporidium creatinivorum]